MTIADKLTQLNTIKQDIKTAINNKGGSVDNNFTTYANAITNLPSGVANGTIVYGKADVVTIEPYDSTVKTIGDRDFQSWTHATGLVIGEGFEIINEYAFYQWTSAASLSLPNTLKTIGQQAFGGWTAFAGELIIPSSVTSIGASAFNGWSKATKLTIKNGVDIIPTNCFSLWAACKSVSLPASVTTINVGAFSSLIACTEFICLAVTPPSLGNTSLSSLNSACVIKVPSASLLAYQSATNWSTHASKMVGI